MAQFSNSGSNNAKTVTVTMDPAEFLKLLPFADRVTFEPNPLEDELTEKNRQLSEAQAVIEALTSTIQKVERDISNVNANLRSYRYEFDSRKSDIRCIIGQTKLAVDDVFRYGRERETCKTAIKEIDDQLKKLQGNEIPMLQLNNEKSQKLALDCSRAVDDARKQNYQLKKEIQICKREIEDLRKTAPKRL